MKAQIFALLLTVSWPSQAAPFGNTFFEAANTNGVMPFLPQNKPYLVGQGTMSDLLPGWTLSLGDFNSQGMFLNIDPSFGLGLVTVISRDAFESGDFPLFPTGGFEGQYAMGFSVGDRPFTLAQRGDIPSDAQLLDIDAFHYPSTSIEGRLNGMPISNGGDISAFAGQKDVLLELILRREFESDSPRQLVGLNGVSFIVPEPGTYGLMGVGGLMLATLLWRRRFSRQKS